MGGVLRAISIQPYTCQASGLLLNRVIPRIRPMIDEKIMTSAEIRIVFPIPTIIAQ